MAFTKSANNLPCLMHNYSPNRPVAILLLIGAMASFQIGASFATTLMQEIGPFAATALRQGFSALFLFFIARLWKFDWTGVKLVPLIMYGLALGLMNLAFYVAITRVPLGIVVAIEFTGPLFVGLISSRRPIDFLWIAFAALGLLILLPFNQFSKDLDKIGIACAVLAAIGWAAYIYWGHHLGKNIEGLSAVAIGILISSMVTVPWGIIDAGEKLLSPNILMFGIILALLSSAIPYSIEMMALKKLTRQNFSLLMSLEPAFAALAGAILLNQILNPLQMIAVSLIVLASIGSTIFNQTEQVKI